MIRKTRIPAIDCTCDLCAYQWYSIAKKLPEICANRKCRSREWNGKKKKRIRPRIVLPKPSKVRVLDDDIDF